MMYFKVYLFIFIFWQLYTNYVAIALLIYSYFSTIIWYLCYSKAFLIIGTRWYKPGLTRTVIGSNRVHYGRNIEASCSVKLSDFDVNTQKLKFSFFNSFNIDYLILCEKLTCECAWVALVWAVEEDEINGSILVTSPLRIFVAYCGG